jgi:nucleoside-diphosphate-sugar epimerase
VRVVVHAVHRNEVDAVVTTPERPVRAGRKSAGRGRRRPVVAVTGAASGLGLSLVGELAAHPGVGQTIAIDARRGSVDAATWRVVDVRDPVLAKRLNGVDVLVHLAWEAELGADPATRRAFNVRAAQTAITSAAAAGVRRVVVLTSAMVYGALPDNAVPLPDGAPLRAVADDSVVGDLLEIEELVERARTTHPGIEVCVVRPAAVVGPGVDSVLTRHFEAPRLLVVRESTPCWQFCHVDDLVSALLLTALGDLSGAVNVASDGWLAQADVERISGLRRIELPASLAFATAERLHRLGITPAPASELQYTVHPWVVSSDRLKAAGWSPTYDNEGALAALLEAAGGRTAIASRRVGRGDAAGLGAAGATVAVLGAAALVRRTRRRRLGG